MTTRSPIDTSPQHIDKSVFQHPVAIMLGIESYKFEDLNTFKSQVQYASILQLANKRKTRAGEEAYDQLLKLLSGERVRLKSNLGTLLSRNPDRLAPLADQLAGYFAKHAEGDAIEMTRLRERISLVADLLVALPEDSYQRVAKNVAVSLKMYFDAQNGRTIVDDMLPKLYLRNAAAGQETRALYRAHLNAWPGPHWLRHLAPLAMCKYGERDPASVELLKTGFQSTTGTDGMSKNYRRAAFLALLSAGEEAFAVSTLHQLDVRDVAWYQDVLDGKDQNAFGPNGCSLAN